MSAKPPQPPLPSGVLSIQPRLAPPRDGRSGELLSGLGAHADARQTQTQSAHTPSAVDAARKTRVGFLVGALELGGAERWLISLLKYCDRSRIEWTGVGLVNEARADTAIVAEVREHVPVFCGDSIAAGVVARSDVLITQFVENLPAFTKRFRGRSVLVSHMTGPWNTQLLSAAARGATELVAVSKAAATCFPEGRPVTLLYNGVDDARVRPNRERDEVRREWGLEPRHSAVGFVGRLAPEKNLPIVAEAVARLGGDYRAVFVGGGPFRDEVARSIVSANPRAIIRPAVRHVGDVLSALDCYVLVSAGEGFSLGLAEAWLSGVPTVVTPVGAVRELEELHGRMTVRVSCPLSAEDISIAITAAVSRANAKIVEHARRVVEANYTAGITAGRWTQYLTAARSGDADLLPVRPPPEYIDAGQDTTSPNDLIASAPQAHIALQVASRDSQCGASAVGEPRDSCEGRSRLRVGVVSGALPLGGAETWVATLIRNLDPTRIEITGVAQANAGASYQALLDRISAVAPLYADNAGIEKLTSESDVLICSGVRELGSLIPESFTGKVALVAHGRTEWDAAIVRDGARRATHFVAVSEFAAKTFDDTGHRQHPVTVIHNGADTDRCQLTAPRERTRFEWGLMPGDIAVGYLGSIKRIKNSLAAAHAAAALGRPFRAVYVGVDADGLTPELLRIFPDAIVREPDFQSGNVLTAFDCFILASDREGFSLALTEAWLLGVPTVATPVGAVPELERAHGKLTVCVPVGASADALAAAVMQAISPANRPVIERAQRVVSRLYTAAAMGTRWTEYLLSLPSSPPRLSIMRPNRSPTVSLIITTATREHFLRECLDSCLRQTAAPRDIVYLADAANGELSDIARSCPGVTIVSTDRRYGTCMARNRGVEASAGEVLIHVDGDSTMPPDFIEKHLAALTAHAPFAYGPVQVLGDHAGFFDVPEWHGDSRSQLLQENWVNSSAAVWRWAFDAAGGWQQTKAKDCLEWYLALRLATLGDPIRSPAILNLRRIDRQTHFLVRLSAALP